MQRILEICRIISAISFLSSGLLICIDPYGVAYRLIALFKAFNLPFLHHLVIPIGVVFGVWLSVIGIGWLLKIDTSFTSSSMLLFATQFAVFSLFAAIFKPIDYCTCFGNPFPLNAWATFVKNWFILACVAYVFWQKERVFTQPCINYSTWYKLSIISAVFLILLSINSYQHLPPIDFRAYSKGSHIYQKMIVPENAPTDEYETILYYKHKTTKEIAAFTEENHPWQDTLEWTYVSMETKKLKAGYQPSILDFVIKTENEEDITELVLTDTIFNFLLVAANLEKSITKNQHKINELYNYCNINNYHFRCLTASTPKEIAQFKVVNKAYYDFYSLDEATLKTMIRSNPGLILMKDGVVIEKWHSNDIPSIEVLIKKYGLTPISLYQYQ